MKFSFLSTYLLALSLSTSSAWDLRTNTGIHIHEQLPQGCKSITIPRGAQISWTGSNGARTLQLFTEQGKCSQVYRTVMGVGDINASSNINGFVVKAWNCTWCFAKQLLAIYGLSLNLFEAYKSWIYCFAQMGANIQGDGSGIYRTVWISLPMLFYNE